MQQAPKIVVSGPIGSGKSTVARRVMDLLQWRRPGGFVTCRRPDAIVMRTWTGREQAVARHSARPEPGRPPYDVDLDAFNRFGAGILLRVADGRPVVLDELGMLELPARGFTLAAEGLFHRSSPVLAVIQQRAIEAWFAIIGKDVVDHLFTVTADNRDTLPGRIAALLK